ncbi:hypothetical protein N2W54_005970 [Lotmaria passim]
MSVCAFAPLASFVADCADVVCAEEWMVQYFLTAIASSPSSASSFSSASLRMQHGGFQTALVGNHERCGAVDLALWLSAPSSSVALDAAAASVTTKTSAALSKAVSSHVWRPIALAVLCFVLLVFVVADTLLLLCVWRKRRAMRLHCSEQDNCPT